MIETIDRHNRAFTIIELVVVLLVTTVLITLSALGLINWKNKSDENRVRADLISIRADIENYYRANNEYPTNANVADSSWRASNSKLSSKLQEAYTIYDCPTGMTYVLEKKVENTSVKFRVTEASSEPERIDT